MGDTLGRSAEKARQPQTPPPAGFVETPYGSATPVNPAEPVNPSARGPFDVRSQDAAPHRLPEAPDSCVGVPRTPSTDEEARILIVETQRIRISRRVATALLGAALATALVVPGVLAAFQPGAAALPQTVLAATYYPYAPWLTDEAFYLKMYN